MRALLVLLLVISCAEDPVILLVGGTHRHVAMLGDSITYGTGDTDNLHDQSLITAYPAVQINQKLGAGTPYADEYLTGTVDLQPFDGGGGFGMGPELTLGRQLNVFGRVGTKISKFACRGSNSTRWLPASADLYPLATAFLDDRVAEFGTIGTLIWDMGTNDANVEANALAWSANNTIIIEALRARYGNFRIVLRKTAPGITYAYEDIVRAQQDAWVAVTPRVTVVTVDDIPLHTDVLHYFADMYGAIGYREAEALVSGSSVFPGFEDPDFAEYVGSISGVSGAGTALTPIAFPCPAESADDGYVEYLMVAHRTAVGAGAAATLSTANGFTLVGSNKSTLAGTLEEWLTVFERRVTSRNMGNPTVAADAAALQSAAQVFAIRQPTTKTGTAIDAITFSQNNANSTAISATGTTSTVNNALVLYITAGIGGSARAVSGQANASLTELTERIDADYFVSANVQLFTLTTGKLATAGATGTLTATATGTLVSSYAAIAIKP